MSNLAVIYNNYHNSFRIAPIYDNGQSLNTGLGYDTVSHSCSTSGSFEEQVYSIAYPIISTFRVDYSRVFNILDGSVESRVLKRNLEKYKSIFNK